MGKYAKSCLYKVAATIAAAVLLVVSSATAQAQVVHLKGNRANGSGAVIGIDKPREGVPKTYLVLTAAHVMKDNKNVSIAGQPVTLIAKDEKTDLALVTVAGIDSAGYFVATNPTFRDCR